MTPIPYDLIIGLDRADKKADLCWSGTNGYDVRCQVRCGCWKQ